MHALRWHRRVRLVGGGLYAIHVVECVWMLLVVCVLLMMICEINQQDNRQ
jgi:uncharacterized membrane protein